MRKTITGFVDYERCKDRDPNFLYKGHDNPHEERFEPIKMTTSLTRIKRTPGF